VTTSREPFDVVRVAGDPEVAEIAILRFRGDERFRVETVDGLSPPRPRASKWIVNVSTQFGCPVGCPICDAGASFHGNLAAPELLTQVRWAVDRHPGDAASCLKLKVHFSRVGEPALNDAVPDAIDALPGVAVSPGLWCCLATTAPRGRERWFERLLDVKDLRFQRRFQLQFSMQSTDPAARARLIPIPHWGAGEISRFAARFVGPGDRRAVLNFALARDVPFDPRVVADSFDPAVFAVKLTPVNPTLRGAAAGYRTRLRGPSDDSLDEAVETLRIAGFDVILSVGDGREDTVRSNCGQVLALASA
jgi:23S rRNA (adenine2503-C2)-methyltransferase